MEQLAVRKGQLAVTLAELNDQSDEDCDTLEFGKKFRKAFNLWQDAEPFEDRLEVGLSTECHALIVTIGLWDSSLECEF